MIAILKCEKDVFLPIMSEVFMLINTPSIIQNPRNLDNHLLKICRRIAYKGPQLSQQLK